MDDQLTINETACRQQLLNNEGYLFFKFIDGEGEKHPCYPETFDEALRIKKEYDSAYRLWYVNKEELFHIVTTDDGEPI